jgi:hypothetical protein
VSPQATGPVFDAGLQASVRETAYSQASFDWNGDGDADRLEFHPGNDSVSVVWAGGQLDVGGVTSDFASDLRSAPQHEDLAMPGPEGPPSSEAFTNGLAAPTPASVSDVTGDGRPDLAVFESGVLHVVVNEPDPRSTEMDAGDDSASSRGWTSSRTEAGTDLPLDMATVVPVGDVNGDGIGDLRVDSFSFRGDLESAFFYGKACS